MDKSISQILKQNKFCFLSSIIMRLEASKHSRSLIRLRDLLSKQTTIEIWTIAACTACWMLQKRPMEKCRKPRFEYRIAYPSSGPSRGLAFFDGETYVSAMDRGDLITFAGLRIIVLNRSTCNLWRAALCWRCPRVVVIQILWQARLWVTAEVLRQSQTWFPDDDQWHLAEAWGAG